MAARLYRNLGRPASAKEEERQAQDKRKMVEALEDPMTDLTHLGGQLMTRITIVPTSHLHLQERDDIG